MLKRAAEPGLAWLRVAGMQAPPMRDASPPKILPWRLDCGERVINQHAVFFFDTFSEPAR